MRACAAFAVAAQLSAGAAFAQATYTTGFEPPEFTAGDVNGQQGWGHISNSPTKGGAKTTVRGTTLETPPAQAAGGGWNSSLSADTVTLASPLAPGAFIDLQWRLGVAQNGNFRFYIKVEALP